MPKLRHIVLCCLAIPVGVAAQSPTVSVTIDPEDCPELIEASQTAGEAYRRAALSASEQIDAGGPLEEEACLGDLRDLNFDFFSGFSTLKGAAIKALKDKAVDAMQNMACDAGKEARSAAETLLTCNASAGLSLDLSAGFGDVNVSECLGAGDINYDYDAGTYGNGGSGYGASFDEEIGSQGSGSTKPAGSNGWSGWLDD